LKVLGIVAFAFCALMSYVMSSTGNSGVGILILGIIILIACWVYKSPRKRQREAAEWNRMLFDNARERSQTNLMLSRAIEIPEGGFFVDDINKKFAISLNGNDRILNFSDLGAFELNEDGNSIAEGKGFATAIGGFAFGTVGALVGSSGKRKSQNTCSSLIVRIMVNDLQNPQIVIKYISNEIRKDNMQYKFSFENAKELISVLHYIEKQEAMS